jgi:aspartate racemase
VADKIIGVLGGLGPWATLDFFEKILRLTPARRDQDHLRVIIDSNAKIPDRSPAILGNGEDPTPALTATARNLERAGAELLVIPCNTAHAFYDAIAASVRIPVLHIMEEVAAVLRREHPEIRRAGVLATHATVAAGLYHRAFAAAGVEVLTPDDSGQEVVTQAIYGVKGAGSGMATTAGVAAVARDLVARGAEALVLGCTELPFVLHPEDVDVPLLDSNLILARAAVHVAKAAGEPVADRS